jgi:hypothetical protein
MESENCLSRREAMKISNTTIVVGVIAYYLLAMAILVGFVVAPNSSAERLAQRDYSDLEKDEGTLTSDIMQLRRELRRGASSVELTKERNFVRQDLLNIVLDRMEPAEESQALSVINIWQA